MLLFSRNCLNGLQIVSFRMILVEKPSKKGSVDTSSVGHTSLTHFSIFSLSLLSLLIGLLGSYCNFRCVLNFLVTNHRQD